MIPKFRAWDKLGKEMHKVSAIDFSSKGARIIRLAEVHSNGKGEHKRWYSTVELMQSTGLIDKNGVEIYEGDIVEFEDETSCYPFDDESSIGTINRAQIVIDNIQGVVLENFMLKNSTVAESYEDYYDLPTYEKAFFFTECRAIGNIYENPELLEDN